MLIKAAPKPAAAAKAGGGGEMGEGSLKSVGPRKQPPWPQGKRTLKGVLYTRPSLALPASPVCGLCAVPPPLTITTSTPQLQVHSHQEVVLSEPFFSASSPHGYIWFLHITLYILRQGEGEIPGLFFFFLYEAIFWCIFCTAKFL